MIGRSVALVFSWLIIMFSVIQRNASFAFTRGRNCRPLFRASSIIVKAAQQDTIIHSVQEEMKSTLVRVFGDDLKDIDPLVFAAKATHGDYQSNVAMSLAKQLKLKPVEIANKLVNSITENNLLEKADVSGPGFINLHLSQSFVKRKILEKLQDEQRRSGVRKTTVPSRIVVDFSSPNIAKEMHVGHLRSTIIGDSLSKVLEFLGHDVVRLNHVGDWGTQFGMLIQFLKETNPDVVSLGDDVQQAASALNIGDLVEFYKAAKKKFDNNPAFQDAARREVVKLQSGDVENVKLWKIICEKSRMEFQSIYDLLSVNLLERGESFYNPMLESLVKELESKGVLVESEGAKCIFLPGYKGFDGNPLPIIVQKSDGGYLYATTDLAAVKQRVETEKAQRIIYVTDSGQAQHFAMVFDAVKLAKMLPTDRTVELTHVPFGLVLGEDGKKIKTRAGESVKLRELLDEAVKLAEEGFVARAKEEGQNMDSADVKSSLKKKAKVMGIGAVKYADLAMNRESNYKFSFNKMLSLNGNTAPYMMYAFVRIQGIKRKAAEKVAGVHVDSSEEMDRKLIELFKSMQSHQILLNEQEEIVLCKHILRFDEVLLEVADRLYPNKLCDYIYELSQKFNQFYEKCPVLKAPTTEQQISRLALCAATSDVLKISLDLLGIETLEQI